MDTKHGTQITDDHQEAFNQIVDVYEKIGRKQPLSALYEELQRTRTDITDVIISGYSGVIHVHRLILRVFAQRCELNIFCKSMIALTERRLEGDVFYHLAPDHTPNRYLHFQNGDSS